MPIEFGFRKVNCDSEYSLFFPLCPVLLLNFFNFVVFYKRRKKWTAKTRIKPGNPRIVHVKKVSGFNPICISRPRFCKIKFIRIMLAMEQRPRNRLFNNTCDFAFTAITKRRNPHIEIIRIIPCIFIYIFLTLFLILIL